MTESSDWPTTYVARRALFNFLGKTFRIFVGGQLAFFVKQKAFKLKEDIVVYADAGQTDARLQIRARSIMDFSATYDVLDSRTGETIGAFQRQGVRSLFRDTWNILGANDAVVGQVVEDTGMLAFLRRLLPIIPQSFEMSLGEQTVGSIRQRFNPFSLVYDVETRATQDGGLDPRLGVAASILLLAIEGRQK